MVNPTDLWKFSEKWIMRIYLSRVASFRTRKAIWLASGLGCERSLFFFFGLRDFAISRFCHNGCQMARVQPWETVPVPLFPLAPLIN